MEFQRALSEGAWLLRTNQPAEALEKLIPLYDVAPTNVDVAINVGGAYILQGKWNKAVKVLSKAAELHPDNVMVWTNLGAAYLGRLELSGPQQQARAIRAYERALEIDPKTHNLHYHLGLIHKDRGDLERSATAFRQALEVDPNDRDAKRWLDRIDEIMQAQAASANGDGASGA
ncbi:MAG: tetratricopeptide repeat protein [Anaerolineales bacterium]|nr:tetratricopeptide repeat protein [Anaerolineales bacterium]